MGKLKHLIETVQVITYNQDVQCNGYETMQDALSLKRMGFVRVPSVCQTNWIQIRHNTTPCVSNKLDPDQAQHYVGPDLDPVYLRGLRADDTSRQLVDRLLSTGSLVRH